MLGRIEAAAPFPLDIFVAARVGSISHGTYIEGSIDDVDILGAVFPPPEKILGLDEWEHWVQFVDEIDITFYSVKKLVNLWSKSNPNVLCLLWMDDFLVRSKWYEEFRAERHIFASRQVAYSFGHYAMAHLRDIHKNRYEGYMGTKRRELVDRFGYDIKNASHLIRLLRMCKEFLLEGELIVMRPDAEELKAIKRGEWTLEQVQSEAGTLFNDIDYLQLKSKLPEKPDRSRASALLAEITMEHLR